MSPFSITQTHFWSVGTFELHTAWLPDIFVRRIKGSIKLLIILFAKGGAELQIIRENPFQLLASLTHDQFLFQNDST